MVASTSKTRRKLYAFLSVVMVLAAVAVVVAASIEAVVELGQPNFTTSDYGASATPNGLALPYGVAVDRSSGHLYIADTANNRVLGWSSISALTNGASADLVIGQTNFTSELNSNTMGNTPVSASGLSSPWSVAVDSNGNLYVSDNGNNRVLEYDSPYNAFGHNCSTATPCEGGLAANLVLGQGTAGNSFTTSTECTTKTDEYCLGEPSGIAIDSMDNLYVADTLNERVLVFLDPLAKSSGCNSPGCAGDVIADYSLGECTGNLGFLDSQANCTHPAVTMQGPNAVAVDSSGNVFVADTQNNRVLEFDNPAGSGNLAADRVYGNGVSGSNFTPAVCSNGKGIDPAPSASSMCEPAGVTLDSANNLYISDYGNSRVLEFADPLTNFSANLVLGQDSSGADFTDGICYGGQPGSGSGTSASATGLCNPAGLATSANKNLFVADTNNSRMIEFQNPAASPSVTATPTATASQIANASPTATASPTLTVSPTATSTTSATATATPTTTASSTLTATRSATPTATLSQTPTPTPTATIPASPTATQTPTASPTFKATVTPTTTPTATPTTTLMTMLSATPRELNFGSVDATGISRPRKVTLSNKGKNPAQISMLTASAAFTIAGGADTCSGHTFAPQKTCSFEVEFAPAKVANGITGTIEVPYNGSSPTVSLEGDAVAIKLKAPSSQTLPAAPPGATGKPGNLIITNHSAASVQLGVPGKLTNFSIASDHCAGVSLMPSSKCVVTMEFAPAIGTTGQITDMLSYGFTYGANSGSVSVMLKGKVK